MKTIRRVLVVQPYGIGDLLFLTPVLRALRTISSVEKVDVLLGSRTEEVVRHNPHVDEIMSVNKDLFHQRKFSENLKEVISLGRKLRDKKYDLLLDYSLRGEYAFFGQFFLGIRRRAGFHYKRRGFFHNIRLPLQEGYQDKHVVDTVCELAERAGIPVEDRFLEFYLRDEDRKSLEDLKTDPRVDFAKRFLIVSPGGGESWGKDAHFKRWPVRYFSDLINQVKKQWDIESVFIVGSGGEHALSEELQKLIQGRSTNWTGKLSLLQVAALMEKAALFIGNDGGLVHLAHALRVPLMAFYGPVDPNVYGPYPKNNRAIAIYKKNLECRPCYKKFRYNDQCVNRECLQDLGPDEVLSQLAAASFLPNASYVH